VIKLLEGIAFEDQSAACRISATVIPDQAALELAVLLIKLALKIPVSMPTSCRHACL